MKPSRRSVLAVLGSAAVLAASPARALSIDPGAFGIVPNSDADQTDQLQAAIDAAAAEGKPLILNAGTYRVRQLDMRSDLMVQGVSGATEFLALSNDPVFAGDGIDNLTLSGLGISGGGIGSDDSFSGLMRFATCTNLTIDACRITDGRGNGIFAGQCSGRIANSTLSGFGLTALFATGSTGLIITGNTISDCANGGIRVFRSETGDDGTIVTENHITNIRSGSGNGQNGNGINVFRANGVIIADNVISDVDFSAVRLNSTEDCIVRGNACADCREVAIFSEFAFAGSIVADNVIDRSAVGISITNFNEGGRLAVCQGNLVRNVLPMSPTNPDVNPVGIYAEADTAITGNVVDNVPGVGIGAGWGEYLRDVMISSNLVRDADYGIGVSVAPGAGKARISGNMISGARLRAISGFAWSDAKGDDLATNPDQFATVSISDNTVN